MARSPASRTSAVAVALTHRITFALRRLSTTRTGSPLIGGPNSSAFSSYRSASSTDSNTPTTRSAKPPLLGECVYASTPSKGRGKGLRLSGTPASEKAASTSAVLIGVTSWAPPHAVASKAALTSAAHVITRLARRASASALQPGSGPSCCTCAGWVTRPAPHG